VMRAEEEVEATGHGDSYVGLRAASVTTIRGVQVGIFDNRSAHGRPPFLTIR
jgi:hypothetical protein